MWQDIIVWIIVAVAALVALRTLWRAVTGRRPCDVDQCANCPFGEDCEEPEKPPCQNTGGCGCH